MVIVVHLDERRLSRIICPFEKVNGIRANVYGGAERTAEEASARTANIGSAAQSRPGRASAIRRGGVYGELHLGATKRPSAVRSHRFYVDCTGKPEHALGEPYRHEVDDALTRTCKPAISGVRIVKGCVPIRDVPSTAAGKPYGGIAAARWTGGACRACVSS